MMQFKIRRGTNASHWLSQSKRRGDERRTYFTQEDVRRIADFGFDHIRLPVDEEQMWTADGNPDAEAFGLLREALDWCGDAGLRVIVDLHILRSHYFNQKAEPALFTEKHEAAKFIELWLELSHSLQGTANDQVAYELLNEPVAQDPENWNRVANAAFGALREVEPNRVIVLGSNWFNTCDTFDKLRVPDDPNCILTFHFYNPMLITHYQARWTDTPAYTGRIQYPGKIALDPVPESIRKYDVEYDRSAMVRDIQKPLMVRKRTGLPLYCGEFGCYNLAPQPTRLAWYRDIISVFREYDIAWGNWDYKGSFGIVGSDGKETGIAEALLS